MTVGERVRSERLARGWSQQQLADKVDLARSTLGDIESGRYLGMQMRTLVNLATVLEVSCDELIYGREEKCSRCQCAAQVNT